MALEPVTITAEEAPNEELISMTRRFWISAVLTAPLVAGRHGRDDGGSAGMAFSVASRDGGELLLATPVVLWGGWPFFERGWSSLVRRNLNMFTLIAIGTGASYWLQRARGAGAGEFSRRRFVRGRPARCRCISEAAAVITTLVLLGQVLELRARSHTSKAIRGLLALGLIAEDGAPGHEDRWRGAGCVPLEQVAAWRPRCACGPGAARARGRRGAPKAQAPVDESMVTGESIPVEKHAGDRGHRRHA